MVNELPEHLKRYSTRAGQDDLAARLGLKIDPRSQDWEWEVARPEMFDEWLAVYRSAPLSDDERFSLMEILIQCVEDTAPDDSATSAVEDLPQWRAVADLLRASPWLHASSIAYWSVLGHDEPEGRFQVSLPMRRVWASVQSSLTEPHAAELRNLS